jgi:hypothetical protein
MDAMGPIAYCEQNALFDASLPRGALNYWKSHLNGCVASGQHSWCAPDEMRRSIGTLTSGALLSS